MNTPAHLLIGAAAFARPARGAVLWAAVLGSVLPDLSLYVMAGVSLHLLGIPPQVVFDELYFSPAWQTVFAIDNSFILWGAGADAWGLAGMAFSNRCRVRRTVTSDSGLSAACG